MKLFNALLLNLLLIFIGSKVFASGLPQWQISTLPNKASLRASAASETVMYVAGTKNSIFKSIDNGKTWLDVSPKLAQQHDFRDIEIINSNTAIAMSVGSGENSKLLITHDQGKSWRLLYQNTDEQGFFDSISFWNEQQGALLGDPVDGHFVVKITQDQGKTWQRINPQILPDMSDNEAAFAASGNTLITGKLGELYFTTGGFSASLYASNDFGQTWQKYSLPLYNTTQTAGGYGLYQLNDAIFILGGDYQQRDGHYSNLAVLQQQKISAIASGNHGLRTAMTCVQKTCVTTGKLAIDISFDAGQSWQVFGNTGFYTLTSNSQTILAAGADGSIAILKLN